MKKNRKGACVGSGVLRKTASVASDAVQGVGDAWGGVFYGAAAGAAIGPSAGRNIAVVSASKESFSEANAHAVNVCKNTVAFDGAAIVGGGALTARDFGKHILERTRPAGKHYAKGSGPWVAAAFLATELGCGIWLEKR